MIKAFSARSRTALRAFCPRTAPQSSLFRLAAGLARIALVWLFVLAGPCCGGPASFAGDLETDIADAVRLHAISAPDEKVLRHFAQSLAGDDGARAFLHSFDRYASLVSDEALKEVQQLAEAYPGGVGMDILRDKKGNIVCIPAPGSQAEQAGVRYGDILVGVDKHRIADYPAQAENETTLTLDEAAVLIRGEPGSPVRLRLIRPRTFFAESARLSAGSSPENEAFTLPITRTTGVHSPSVAQLEHVGNIPHIRIFRFSPTTASELDNLLQKMPSGKALVLDLRGNTGGDVRSAQECLRHFLPAGATLYRHETGGKRETFRAKANGSHASTFLYIWQDELTASAAEMIIAALRQTDRAMSIGCHSAGKSCVQEWFTLRDGYRLKLTTERLLLPGENAGWQDTGLAPDVPLRDGEDFSAATAKLASN